MTGDCLLNTIEVQREALLAFLASQSASLDLSAVGDADISFVQLIVSAARSAGEQDRELVLTGASPALCATFERAGFGIDPASGLLTSH